MTLWGGRCVYLCGALCLQWVHKGCHIEHCTVCLSCLAAEIMMAVADRVYTL